MKAKLKEQEQQYKDLLDEIKEANKRLALLKKAKQDIASRYKGPKTFVTSEETLLQKDYNKYMPPNSYLRIARTDSAAWMFRVPPNTSEARYWKREGGEEPALRLCIQDAWRTWLELEGLDCSEWPVADLL